MMDSDTFIFTFFGVIAVVVSVSFLVLLWSLRP